MNTEINIEEEIDEALAYHGGDVRATIAALIADREFLAKELSFASIAMSYGFARGWQPSAPMPGYRKDKNVAA